MFGDQNRLSVRAGFNQSRSQPPHPLPETTVVKHGSWLPIRTQPGEREYIGLLVCVFGQTPGEGHDGGRHGDLEPHGLWNSVVFETKVLNHTRDGYPTPRQRQAKPPPEWRDEPVFQPTRPANNEEFEH